MLLGVPAALYATLVTLAAIGAATAAVWHGSIDGQTFTAIVTGALGLGAGAGIHAAGTQQATTSAAVTAAATTAAAATLDPKDAEIAALRAQLAGKPVL
jgi:hypothetical protein